MSQYDIVFIGGGPAGYEGAILAGKRGLKTAVVEKEQLGGTCLQRGCIPTKAILHSVKLIKEMQNCSKLGIEIEGLHFSYPAILSRKNRVVNKLMRGIELQFKTHRVELIKGTAQLSAADRISVGQVELSAKHIIIATGSLPVDLPFLKFNGSTVLSSDDVLRLEEIPSHLLIVGAGAVGIEWALIYRYLGAKVTLLEIMPQVLPGSESEIADILKTELQKQEISVYTQTSLLRANIQTDKGIEVGIKGIEKEWTERVSHILLAVGRKPNAGELALSTIGIETDSKGFIKVNENLQTSCSSIFACGDIIGTPLLAHKAAHQAMAIVNFLTRGSPVVHHAMPAAVFSFPETASVGLTEADARKRGVACKIGRFPYAAGSRANAVEEKVGLVKIIADESDRLLGAHIIGAEASELMPLLVFAIDKGMKAEDFQDQVFIHPTLSEGLWETLGAIGGFSIHI